MPTVRDDLRICQSHRRTNAPPLPCPLHIVAGLDDPVAPPHTMAAWASYSVQPQPVRSYPGGHFLFRSPDPALVATVARVASAAAPERNLLPSQRVNPRNIRRSGILAAAPDRRHGRRPGPVDLATRSTSRRSGWPAAWPPEGNRPPRFGRGAGHRCRRHRAARAGGLAESRRGDHAAAANAPHRPGGPAGRHGSGDLR